MIYFFSFAVWPQRSMLEPILRQCCESWPCLFLSFFFFLSTPWYQFNTAFRQCFKNRQFRISYAGRNLEVNFLHTIPYALSIFRRRGTGPWKFFFFSMSPGGIQWRLSARHSCDIATSSDEWIGARYTCSTRPFGLWEASTITGTIERWRRRYKLNCRDFFSFRPFFFSPCLGIDDGTTTSRYSCVVPKWFDS